LGENRKGKTDTDGRDHHPGCYSMWMAGGGVKGGYTHGESDDIGWNIVKDGVHVNDFQATLLHMFGLDHNHLTYRHRGLDQKLTSITRQSEVIHDLLA
jgi:hypothetical protein